ncbi:hypothetical protein PMAYCL1PPCAC_14243, partial [Pristionchus mayeri]
LMSTDYLPKEPKEEPLDDFPSMPPDNEIKPHPSEFLKEPKEEPLLLFHPYSLANEANDHVCRGRDV